MNQIFLNCLAFSLAVLCILVLRPASITIGLVDNPGGRKQHTGSIPIVGGLAMYFAFIVTSIINGFFTHHLSYFMSLSLIVLLGFCDDYLGLSARVRLLLQVAAALIVTVVGGNYLQNLGDLLGNGTVLLGMLSIPFTSFAIIALMNAINMLDGVDGLAGCIVMVQLLALILMTSIGQLYSVMYILISVLAVLAGYLLFNVRFPGRQQAHIFMGDAGSMFLGFTLAWFFVDLSHTPHGLATPMAMLFICAVPVFDIATVVLRRLIRGGSIMSADREHIHHVLKDLGYSDNAVVGILSLGAVVLAGIGLFASLYHVPDRYLLSAFLSLFLIYQILLQYCQRLR